MGRSLQVSQQQTPSLEQKMGLKLATLLLFLSLLNISQANPAKDDSEKHLANSPAKPIAANQDGHLLEKREAGKEGRKRSCQGKGCSKKKTPKKKKKGGQKKKKKKKKKKKS